LRFPEVTAQKLRVRVLEARSAPAIANISGYYYKSRPPQLSLERTIDGMVSIFPKKENFGWNPHGEDAAGNINSGYLIRYTTDGSEPDQASPLYDQPFSLSSGEVKAVAEVNGQLGSTSAQLFGILKKDWKLLGADSFSGKNKAENAFDGKSATYWSSDAKDAPHYIAIDLGQTYSITGFTYTPQTVSSDGMIEKGVIKTSSDGKSWKVLEDFGFGNLINDPSIRTHRFKVKIKTRYIRIESKVIAGDKKTAAIAEVDFLLE